MIRSSQQKYLQTGKNPSSFHCFIYVTSDQIYILNSSVVITPVMSKELLHNKQENLHYSTVFFFSYDLHFLHFAIFYCCCNNITVLNDNRLHRSIHIVSDMHTQCGVHSYSGSDTSTWLSMSSYC